MRPALAAPIFIIGTERSGSNLLRMILNAHSQIAAPHPPHFMAYFGPLETRYGDLSLDRNFRALADDLIAHVNQHIHPWPIRLSSSQLFTPEVKRDLLSAAYAIYDQYVLHVGKIRWACKSTFMIDYTSRILERYPDAKLIWLVRDPRDVANSSIRSVFNPFHPYYTSQLWNAQQSTGLALEGALSSETILRVHYETLINQPECTIRKICAFIGAPFESNMLRYFDTDDARASAQLSMEWSNIGAPILSDNTGKYAAGLSEEDVAIVEAVAAPTMTRLGYSPTARRPAAERPSAATLARYRARNEWLRIGCEFRSITADKIGLRRWLRALRMAVIRLRLRLTVSRRRAPSRQRP